MSSVKFARKKNTCSNDNTSLSVCQVARATGAEIGCVMKVNFIRK